jgi:uncharacterized protein YigE (DUF2233 family)
MTSRRYTTFALSLTALMLLVGACSVDPNATPVFVFPTRVQGSPIPTFPGGGGATAFPTVPGFPTQPIIATTPPFVEVGWNFIANGVVWRSMPFRNAQGATIDVRVVRFDPAAVQFRVHYVAGQVQNITGWQQRLSGAAAIINANYFDPNNNPLGIVVADGRPAGTLYNRTDAAMFQVKPGGAAKVRYMYIEPYQNGEPFEQATMAFPVLFAERQRAPIAGELSTVSAPRTVIASDTLGRILFIVARNNTTLAELQAFLGASGLSINYAVNMDGGSSSSMFINTNDPSARFSGGLRAVPVVVAAYPR